MIAIFGLVSILVAWFLVVGIARALYTGGRAWKWILAAGVFMALFVAGVRLI